MPTFTPYLLSFPGGLHLGALGINLEEAAAHIPSDTLFAALLDAWRRAGGDVDALAAPFVSDPADPPFLLTSAFPFCGEVRFYPMPVDLTRLMSARTARQRGKEIKGVRYLSEGLVRRVLGGEALDAALFPEEGGAEAGGGLCLQGGALWLSAEEAPLLAEGFRRAEGRRHALRSLQVWASERTPRVTVDRVSASSTIYHAGRVRFAEGCGLWFGVAWRRPDAPLASGGPTFRAAFARALGVLEGDGLGGERSAGYGAFVWREGAAVTLPDPRPDQPAWLLSRYHPRPSELPEALAGEGAAYVLTMIGGWVRSLEGGDQRRRRLLLVGEGSLIRAASDPAGDVVDVRPRYRHAAGDLSHPVYRYGLALAIQSPTPTRPGKEGARV